MQCRSPRPRLRTAAWRSGQEATSCADILVQGPVGSSSFRALSPSAMDELPAELADFDFSELAAAQPELVCGWEEALSQQGAGSFVARGLKRQLDPFEVPLPSLEEANPENLLKYALTAAALHLGVKVSRPKAIPKKDNAVKHILGYLVRDPTAQAPIPRKANGTRWAGRTMFVKAFRHHYGGTYRTAYQVLGNLWKQASPAVRHNWAVVSDCLPEQELLRVIAPGALTQKAEECKNLDPSAGYMFTWHTDWGHDDEDLQELVTRGIAGDDLAAVIKRRPWLKPRFGHFVATMTPKLKALGADHVALTAEMCYSGKTPGRIHLHVFACSEWKGCTTKKHMRKWGVVNGDLRYEKWPVHTRALDMYGRNSPDQACAGGLFYILSDKVGQLAKHCDRKLVEDLGLAVHRRPASGARDLQRHLGKRAARSASAEMPARWTLPRPAGGSGSRRAARQHMPLLPRAGFERTAAGPVRPLRAASLRRKRLAGLPGQHQAHLVALAAAEALTPSCGRACV